MRRVFFLRSKLVLGAIAAVLALAVASVPADAAKKKSPQRKEASQKKQKKGGGYAPPFSALVVDASTGKVLYADSPDGIRHPASLTKVMTLYILFDELSRGALTLDTPLKVSAEGARQEPSKLGLLPGETIRVEDAIKAIVTKSANDVAVTIAENISGSEAAFAQRMTAKARALGMSNTVYRNASGLPNPAQVTTARDLATLGRAIQGNHPKYYPYFSTRSFTWKGRTIGNHNRLLGSVKGVDGIKTGFIRASGFNLLTSANDNGRRVVGVVLGGRSGASRDATMRDLVATNIGKAAPNGRSAPAIAEAPMPAAPMPVVTARASSPQPAPVAQVAAIAPIPAARPAEPTPTPRTIAQPVAVVAAPVPLPVAATIEIPAPEPASPTPQPATQMASVATMTPDAIARRIAMATDVATTTPQQGMRWVVGAQPASGSVSNSYAGGTTPGSAPPRQQVARAEPVPQSAARPTIRTDLQPVEASLFPASQPTQVALATAPPQPAVTAEPSRSGWIIQIVATPDAAQAQAFLDRSSATVRKVDAKAEPFMEPVAKGDQTLYRARYAGLSESTANAACRALKRSSMSCFTIKN